MGLVIARRAVLFVEAHILTDVFVVECSFRTYRSWSFRLRLETF